VSVCGTVNQSLHQTFSRLLRLDRIAFGSPRQLSVTSQEKALAPSSRASTWTPTPRPTYLQAQSGFFGSRPCTTGRYRNINLLSIAYGYYPLGLGPTNPTRIHLPSETLGLRRTRFARAFSLLIPAFSLRLARGRLTASPSSRPNAPLPKRRGLWLAPGSSLATASVVGLSPDGLSVQDHSTSELLRTLSRMAASKPTSWLSE
jgi:hypothetical protein